MLEDLRGVMKRVRQVQRRAGPSGPNYLETHQDRLDYDEVQKHEDPAAPGSTSARLKCGEPDRFEHRQQVLGIILARLAMTASRW